MSRFVWMVFLVLAASTVLADDSERCEQLLCVSTGVGRTQVNQCSNKSLSHLWREVWNTYDDNYCYQTKPILSKGDWTCGLSHEGSGMVAMVAVEVVCVTVYGKNIRIADVVAVNGAPGAIVIGGQGTPIGGGGSSGSSGGSSGGGGSYSFPSFTVNHDDEDHTVSGKVVCTASKCTEQHNVD